jgi:hypothetical protein
MVNKFKFTGLRVVYSYLLFICLISANVPKIYASVPSSTPPKLAFDTIRGESPSYIDGIAKGLGFETRKIIGNAIVESDLADIDILVLYGPETPYLTQTEIDLILNFVEGGGGIYIVPMHSNSPKTFYNDLYEKLGFKISGTLYYLNYPDIKNVTFSHPIMDGVSHIKVYGSYWVVELSLLTEPAERILLAENHALLLVSTYGSGRAFIDLTNGGIRGDYYDNNRVVRNALIWLMDYHKETFRLSVDGSIFDVTLETNSIISSFDFKKDEKLITFQATGLLGTNGYSHLSVPAGLMWGNIYNWKIYVDGQESSKSYVEQQGDAYLIHVYYEHSTHQINITSPEAIPEFQSFLILPIFVIITIVLAIIHKRKRIGISKG